MAAITTSAISIGMAGYQMYQGAEQKKKAEQALNDYDRQELDNAFENIQISTVGSDLMREENQRNTATAMDTISQAGDRAIIGGVPRVVATGNNANREAQKYLDDQVIRRDYAIAGDNTRIEGLQEGRDNMNISALGQQVQAGNQDMWSGMMGVGSALAYGARNIKGGGGQDTGGGLSNADVPEHLQTSGVSADPNSPYPFGTTDPNQPVPFDFATSYQAPRTGQIQSGGNPYNPFMGFPSDFLNFQGRNYGTEFMEDPIFR